jgi:hypothetical protein
MRFENIWLIIISAVIATATVVGAILFVFARNQGTEGESQVSIPKLSEHSAADNLAVEETVTRAVFMVSPANPDRLVPVEREVYNLIPLSMVAGQVIQELLKGPQEGEFGIAPLPRQARLKSFYFSERGLAVVILNNDTRKYHPSGTDAELMSIYAVVNTLCVNFPSIQAVQIVIEDAADTTFAGHIDISYPLTFDEDYLTGMFRDPLHDDVTEAEDGQEEAAVEVLPGEEISGPVEDDISQ